MKFKPGDIVVFSNPDAPEHPDCAENSWAINYCTVNKAYVALDARRDREYLKIKTDTGVEYFVNPNQFTLKSNPMELKITKEKILEAVATCPAAKDTLKTLFPEVFKPERGLIKKLESEATISIFGYGVTGIRIAEYWPSSSELSRRCFLLDPSYTWEWEDNGLYKLLIPTPNF